MLTVYIDDSGTAKDQKEAVAAAIIVPAHNLNEISREWEAFDGSYKFGRDFHASECAAKNQHKVYANWNDRTVDNALARARRITKRNSLQGISITFNKPDLEELFPDHYWEQGGREPFTWCLRSLLNLVRLWIKHNNHKLEEVEYVVDFISHDDPRHAEVHMLFAQFESAFVGEYEGKWSFRKRKDVPGLQCVDQLAWACFNQSRVAYAGTSIGQRARTSYEDFNSPPGWLQALGHDKDALRHMVSLDLADKQAEDQRKGWSHTWKAKQEQERIAKTNQKRKKKKS